MQWATPAFSWWLLAVVPLLGLFMLRMKPRRESVSSLLFWDEAVPEGRTVRWLHQWRDRLMFLIHLLLLLLLVIALMEPRWRGNRQEIAEVVLVVDNSASMQAAQGQERRWEEVVRTADSYLASLSSTARVTLRRIAPGLDSLGTVGHLSPASARRVVRQWQPSDAPGNIEPILQQAVRKNDASTVTFQDAPLPSRKQVVVITDAVTRHRLQQFQTPVRPPQSEIKKYADVQWLQVGAPTANTGITQLQTRRSFTDPLSFEIGAEISHFSDQPRETTLEISLGDSLLDVVPLRLAPNQVWQQTWTHHSASGGPMTARLVDPDRFTLDDHAFAWLDPRPARKVILVTTGSLYLETVLRAIPWVELEVRSTLPPDDTWPIDGLIIFHRMPVTTLPRGKSLLVDVRTSGSHWTVNDDVIDTLVARQADSSWLTHIDLLDQVVSGVRAIEFTERPTEVLLESAEGFPIYALLDHERGQSLLLNVDLERSDLAWRTAFPLLIVQAIQGLFPQESDFRRAMSAGQTISMPMSQAVSVVSTERQVNGTASWQLVAPSGIRRPLATVEGEWRSGELSEVGFWSIERTPESTTGTDRVKGDANTVASAHSKKAEVIAQVACNLASAQESELRWNSEANVSDRLRSTAQATGWSHELWHGLLVLSIGATVVEWFLYQRRWIGG